MGKSLKGKEEEEKEEGLRGGGEKEKMEHDGQGTGKEGRGAEGGMPALKVS